MRELGIALHVHALDATAIDEVVDVGGCPAGLQRRVDVGDRDAERARLFAIDVELELRRVFDAVRTHAREPLVLRRGA